MSRPLGPQIRPTGFRGAFTYNLRFNSSAGSQILFGPMHPLVSRLHDTHWVTLYDFIWETLNAYEHRVRP